MDYQALAAAVDALAALQQQVVSNNTSVEIAQASIARLNEQIATANSQNTDLLAQMASKKADLVAMVKGG